MYFHESYFCLNDKRGEHYTNYTLSIHYLSQTWFTLRYNNAANQYLFLFCLISKETKFKKMNKIDKLTKLEWYIISTMEPWKDIKKT